MRVGAYIDGFYYGARGICGGSMPRWRWLDLRALAHTDSATCIELGNYVSRVAIAPLATKGHQGQPVLVKSDWPIMIQDAAGQGVPSARFMASIARREEKAATSTSHHTCSSTF